MLDLIKGFFLDVLNEAGNTLDDWLLDQLGVTLNVETLPAVSGILTSNVIEKLYGYIYYFAVSLLVLKFLVKGFQIYVLWRDGDADASPQDMLTGTAQAIIVAVGFPIMYERMAGIASQFTGGLMSLLGLTYNKPLDISGPSGILALPSVIAGGFWTLVLLVIYLILLAVLYIKLLQRGFELLILRLGVPFACMGLVDSDFGIFKSYMQIFIKTIFTSIIQIVLLSLSFLVVGTGHFIVGIAIIATAFSAPLIMQQLLVPTSRGGGMMSKVYTTSMAVRAVRGLMGR